MKYKLRFVRDRFYMELMGASRYEFGRNFRVIRFDHTDSLRSIAIVLRRSMDQ